MFCVFRRLFASRFADHHYIETCKWDGTLVFVRGDAAFWVWRRSLCSMYINRDTRGWNAFSLCWAAKARGTSDICPGLTDMAVYIFHLKFFGCHIWLRAIRCMFFCCFYCSVGVTGVLGYCRHSCLCVRVASPFLSLSLSLLYSFFFPRSVWNHWFPNDSISVWCIVFPSFRFHFTLIRWRVQCNKCLTLLNACALCMNIHTQHIRSNNSTNIIFMVFILNLLAFIPAPLFICKCCCVGSLHTHFQ